MNIKNVLLRTGVFLTVFVVIGLVKKTSAFRPLISAVEDYLTMAASDGGFDRLPFDVVDLSDLDPYTGPAHVTDKQTIISFVSTAVALGYKVIAIDMNFCPDLGLSGQAKEYNEFFKKLEEVHATFLLGAENCDGTGFPKNSVPVTLRLKTSPQVEGLRRLDGKASLATEMAFQLHGERRQLPAWLGWALDRTHHRSDLEAFELDASALEQIRRGIVQGNYFLRGRDGAGKSYESNGRALLAVFRDEPQGGVGRENILPFEHQALALYTEAVKPRFRLTNWGELTFDILLAVLFALIPHNWPIVRLLSLFIMMAALAGIYWGLWLLEAPVFAFAVLLHHRLEYLLSVIPKLWDAIKRIRAESGI